MTSFMEVDFERGCDDPGVEALSKAPRGAPWPSTPYKAELDFLIFRFVCEKFSQ